MKKIISNTDKKIATNDVKVKQAEIDAKIDEIKTLGPRPKHALVHIIPIEIINTGNTDYFEIIEIEEPGEKFGQHNEKRRNIIDRALRYLLSINVDLRRGDIVNFEYLMGYRNSGVMIFNGIELQDLCSDMDDYGSVPENFQVIGEFPICYWHAMNAIDHNYIVWFDISPYVQELIDNFNSDNQSTWFTYNKVNSVVGVDRIKDNSINRSSSNDVDRIKDNIIKSSSNSIDKNERDIRDDKKDIRDDKNDDRDIKDNKDDDNVYEIFGDLENENLLKSLLSVRSGNTSMPFCFSCVSEERDDIEQNGKRLFVTYYHFTHE